MGRQATHLFLTPEMHLSYLSLVELRPGFLNPPLLLALVHGINYWLHEFTTYWRSWLFQGRIQSNANTPSESAWKHPRIISTYSAETYAPRSDYCEVGTVETKKRSTWSYGLIQVFSTKEERKKDRWWLCSWLTSRGLRMTYPIHTTLKST